MRILVLGDGGAPTGFARVVSSILVPLAERHEIHQVAVNYKGDPHGLPWNLYPAAAGGDPFGVERIREIVERVRPELVFSVTDFWVQRDYWAELEKCAPDVPVVSYSPVDAGPIDEEWLAALPDRVRLFVYTEFGRREVSKVLSPLRAAELGVIPHGVDTSKFFPIPGEDRRRRAREQLGIRDGGSAFIVLNANRNQPRKRIDLTLDGFARFAKGKPETVQLLLHMGLSDVGWAIRRLATRYGIEERLILTGPLSGGPPSISDEQLNLVYNACDVGINTSGAEGWGLPAVEHAATGAAQIVPRHSACEEIWTGSAELLDAPDLATQPSTLLDFRFPRATGVAEALERLYADADARRRVADRCYQVATRPEYAWSALSARWEGLFKDAVSGGPNSAPER